MTFCDDGAHGPQDTRGARLIQRLGLLGEPCLTG